MQYEYHSKKRKIYHSLVQSVSVGNLCSEACFVSIYQIQFNGVNSRKQN